MTTLSWGLPEGLLVGLTAPGAGDAANDVARLTVATLEEMKSAMPAASSFVFNDLQTLAKESDTEVRANPAFLLAQRFLLALPTHFPAPELALDSDGEISFDWTGVNGGLLTVTLREDGRASYAARISAMNKDHGTKQFTDAIPKEILELVQRVARA